MQRIPTETDPSNESDLSQNSENEHSKPDNLACSSSETVAMPKLMSYESQENKLQLPETISDNNGIHDDSDVNTVETPCVQSSHNSLNMSTHSTTPTTSQYTIEFNDNKLVSFLFGFF